MGSFEGVPCDFCGERTAVLFCRADTAKLCLPCDQKVHTANLLSRKHVRSQICDNCGNEPVSVQCFTDNFVLCQECDYDVHGSCSVSDAHVRSAVDGFSGCPSVLELAALWGLDLEGRKEENEVPMVMDNFGLQYDPWISGANVLQELIVPVPVPVANDTTFKKRSSSCGRYKQVLCKQLEELLKNGVVGVGGEDDVVRDCNGDGDGEGGDGFMVPVMPERLEWTRGFDPEEINVGGVIEQPTTTSFTSLQWNPSNGHSTQIWDFNLGQSRGPDKTTSQIEEAALFKINNFADLINESSSTKVKDLKETCQDDYSSGKTQAIYENNNLPITFGSEKGSNSSSSCSTTTKLVATKADLE